MKIPRDLAPTFDRPFSLTGNVACFLFVGASTPLTTSVNGANLILTRVVNNRFNQSTRRGDSMQEIMPGIEPEKRDRILNAAIEEFASFPFEKASTNHIVAKAGISKGLLFHYFGSKQ